MNIEHKDATITPAGTDEDFPGSFEVILSAPTEDRDGETLLASEWKMPLPDRISFDIDHGMTVATTVGSGTPSIDDKGQLVVSGTYSSLPRAQDLRTLVREGHIRTTSVAFMTSKSTKDGTPTVTRELLNGAFVPIPSNREALVVSSKAAAAILKLGARNAAADMTEIQAIHDSSQALGASCGSSAPAKSFGAKAGEPDPVALIQATDAALDQALELIGAVEITTLPAEVQQAIALLQAADAAIDEAMEAVGIPDPDEAPDSATDPEAAAATPDSAAAATPKSAAVESAEPHAVTPGDVAAKALAIIRAQFSN